MSHLIDFAILALLAGVLGYAWLVDRRVRHLVGILREMAPMVDEFSAAVDRSEGSLSAFKAVTQAIEGQVREGLNLRPRRAAAAPAPEPAPAPQPQADDPVGVASVTGKADLVRSFFATARSREA
ncbi:MAG: flagellar motor switch protein [Pseudooceanicola sp.]|nr:flagellar motor switch protein [Pseudooceanicola sp.]